VTENHGVGGSIPFLGTNNSFTLSHLQAASWAARRLNSLLGSAWAAAGNVRRRGLSMICCSAAAAVRAGITPGADLGVSR